MYQWVETSHSETKQKLGGGEETVTTYTYSKEWRSSPVNSSNFKEASGHENPPFDFEGGEVDAKTGTIGVFTLTEGIIGKMGWFEPYKVEAPAVEAPATETPADSATPETPATPADSAAPETPVAPADSATPEAPAVPSETTADEAPAGEPVAQVAQPEAPAAPEPVAAPAEVAPATTQTTEPAAPAADALTPEAIAAANGVPEGYIYYQDRFYKGDPKKLSVGDVRVFFEYVPNNETISLISGQQGDTFAPFQTKYNQIELVEKGVVSAEAMFKHAHNANSMICWALRLAGFAMMFFGLKLIFEPLKVIADVVPFIGTIIGMGTGFVAFVLAAGFSLLTIAIGWVAYRPLIGVPILIAAIVFLLMPFFKAKKAAPAPAPQPENTFEK